MKIVTGLGCPGCGMTRSVSAAAHGRIVESVRMHALGPAILLVVVGLWFALLFGVKVRVDHPWTTKVLVGLVFALIAYWMVRVFLGAVP